MAWRSELLYSYGYGGATRDEAYGLTPISGGGYAICGKTDSYGAGGNDFLFMKFNGDGGFLSGSAMGFPADNYGRSLVESSSGNFFLTGTAYNTTQGNYDIYVYNLDATGNILFEGGYGTSPGSDYGEDCIETSDNNYVLIGRTSGLGAGGYDMYVCEEGAKYKWK
jgi:hypothetical protein